MRSFNDSTCGCNGLPIEDLLNVWGATMIEKGIAVSSRKRYFTKLGSIYKEFTTEEGIVADEDPFESAKAILDSNRSEFYEKILMATTQLEECFDSIVKDAERRPSLAVFLYLLLNASPDIEKAIALRTEEYTHTFAQLDDVIAPEAFHHRRRYVFNLSQSQKRMPQLVKEVCSDIHRYLWTKGVKLDGARLDKEYIGAVITSLWISKAREIGIGFSDICAAVVTMPREVDYLSHVRPSDISLNEIESIKRRVADSFAPATSRWYAMKLRRGVSFDSVCTTMRALLPTVFHKIEFFYPVREVAKRDGKKIVREKIPFIPDIVFFNTLPRYVKDIDSTIRDNNIGWVFRIVNTLDSGYSIIDNSSMLTFEKAVGRFSSDMKIMVTDRPPVEIGRRVRITGGIMEGYEGTIYDVSNDIDNNCGRMFCIKLSTANYVRLQVNVEDYYIEPIDNTISA